jgi:hypothetical protein
MVSRSIGCASVMAALRVGILGAGAAAEGHATAYDQLPWEWWHLGPFSRSGRGPR